MGYLVQNLVDHCYFKVGREVQDRVRKTIAGLGWLSALNEVGTEHSHKQNCQNCQCPQWPKIQAFIVGNGW